MRCLFAVSSWFVQRASLTVINIDLSDRMVAKCRIRIWEKESVIGVQWFEKNPNPWVHRSVGNSKSLVYHWKGWPTGWNFSVPTEHQWWILFISQTVPALEKNENELPHVGRTSVRDVLWIMKWRHHIAYECIHDFLEVFLMFFQFKMRYLVVNKKKNPLFVWGWDKKIYPADHHFSSLRKPCDANLWSSGWIFLSRPYTHEGFL